MSDARVAAEIGPATLWARRPPKARRGLETIRRATAAGDHRLGGNEGQELKGNLRVFCRFPFFELYSGWTRRWSADYGTGTSRLLHCAETGERRVSASGGGGGDVPRGANRPDRPVGATFEHAVGCIDPTGPIARLPARHLCADGPAFPFDGIA